MEPGEPPRKFVVFVGIAVRNDSTALASTYLNQWTAAAT